MAANGFLKAMLNELVKAERSLISLLAGRNRCVRLATCLIAAIPKEKKIRSVELTSKYIQSILR